ncbi:MAG TPA: HEAT repeat domain-containing protein, partial [Candidatus Saccharimonadales bacterium]|nr:HEAT repeat domain-containing protein [Candidatus Saccharimonadales bacterium]
IRDYALFAMRETYDLANAEALAAFVKNSADCGECRAAALPVLAELHHKRPLWNGNWWATQPVKSPPPAKTIEWEGTPLVLATVREALNDASLEVRLAAIEAVEITKDQQSAQLLGAMFEKESEVEIRKSILKALAVTKAPVAAALVVSVLNQADQFAGLLAEAVAAGEKLGGKEIVQALNKLVTQPAGTPVQKDILLALGTLKSRESIPVLEQFATAPDTNISASAISSIAKIGGEPAFKALAPLLDDSQVSVRRSAIAGLGMTKNKEAVPLLIVAYTKPETRNDSLLALSALPDLRALDIYLQTLDDKSGTIRDASRRALENIRRQALPGIEAEIRNGKQFSAATLSTLQRIYKEDDKAREGPIFKSQIDLKSTEPAAFSAFASTHSGDAAHGKAVFNDLKGLACVKCHKVSGQGGEVGPDLTSVGGKYNRSQIIEAILYPSKLILDGYQQTIVFTKDGDSLAGIVRGETAEEVTLVDTEGKKHVFPKKTIETRKSSELSLMPEGLQVGLSKQDFSDVVSYVETLKDKPAASR